LIRDDILQVNKKTASVPRHIAPTFSIPNGIGSEIVAFS